MPPGTIVALGGGGFSPHYDTEPERRPTYRRLVAGGLLPAGYAADDGAAILFDGRDIREVVTERPGATAWRVERVDGATGERSLPVRDVSS